MKYLFILLATMGLSHAAFAEDYRCDQPVSKDGERIQGGPSYDVTSDADNGVFLVINQGVVHGPSVAPTEVKMKHVGHSIDGPEIYHAGNVTVTFNNFYLGGVVRTSVTLDLKQGGRVFEAACK